LTLILLMKKSLLITGLALISLPLSAEEKTTYADHVRPLLENKCFSCHNPDKKKGDLDLTSFAGAMTGGGSGAVINAGDPDGSKLIATVTKKAEPYMPPEGSPLSAKEVEILSKWIQGGVLETASSVAKKSAPKANLTLSAAPKGKPEGPPAVPENVLLEPVVAPKATSAITAMAGSPWAPLLAVSGQRQALIYDMNNGVLAGIYPYPEGYIRSLKFSQNGALLIAGGGRGGKNGNAVVWDVKTGRRVTEVGKEFDQVMGADISANHSLIAIGSPSKKVKVFNANSGEELYVIKRHTEWVLAVAFSPDGVLLASADRNGNVLVTEAATGGEFYTLDGHKLACNALSWRADGNILASCSEDGKISLWEMEAGKLVKSWDAHAGGVLAVNFLADGRLVSSGRDGTVRTWDITGKKLAESANLGDIVDRVAGVSDGKIVASGDWHGTIKVWTSDKFQERATLTSSPGPIAQRIAETERLATELVASLPKVEEELKGATANVKAKEDAAAAARKAEADAKARQQQLEKEVAQLPAQIDGTNKAIEKAKADKQAATVALQKFTATQEQVKKMDEALAKLTADRSQMTQPEKAPQAAELDKKIAEQKAQVEAARKEIATPPPAVAGFDKTIAETTAQIAAWNKEKPVKLKAIEDLKKQIPTMPKGFEALDKQVAEAKDAQAQVQQKLADQKAQLAFAQKYPTYLKAAQFNVGLLGEKETLAKLEADFIGYTEAQKDATAAREAALNRIPLAKKSIADATAALPAKEAAFVKIAAELPPVEKILEPTKAQESKLAGELAEQQKIMATKEAELTAATKEKADTTAAAQKAVTDITAQMAALQKQLGEVSTKAAAPVKTADAKKAELTKADAELAAVKQQIDTASKDAETKNADVKAKEAALVQIKPQFEAAQNAIQPVRAQQQPAQNAVTQKKSEQAAKEKALADAQQAGKNDQIPALQKAVDEAKAATAAAEKKLGDINTQLAAAEQAAKVKAEANTAAVAALNAARQAQGTAQTALNQAKTSLQSKQTAQTRLKGEFDAAEKVAAPLRGQQGSLVAQIDAMKKKIADQQAIPGKADQDFNAKSAAINAVVAQAKTTMAPIEKQLGEVRAKLAADTKIVDAKRAEVAKAKDEADALKKALADGQKTIEASTKEIADKEKSLVEIKAELAKVEPQLQPQRDKVKKLTEQFLAMLPKP
jgi:predicted  nucleic acid-binding Zn-ribbon protein